VFSSNLERKVFVFVLLLKSLQLAFPDNSFGVEVKDLGNHQGKSE
jgi:hypothetical protein